MRAQASFADRIESRSVNIADLFLRSAKRDGGRPAVALGSSRLWSYADLASRAAAIAGSLTGKHGLQRGDRVAFAMRNRPDHVELLLACWWAGLVVVPLDPSLPRAELSWILDHAGARILFVSADLAPGLADLTDEVPTLECVFVAGTLEQVRLLNGERQALADVDDDALAWIVYTSGTGGRAKGAMITHRNLRAMTAAYLADVDRIESGDAMIYTAPLAHGSGLYLLPHAAQAAVHVMPESGSFDEAELVALLKSYRAATTFMAPPMVRRLARHAVAHDPDCRNLKTLVYGGAPMARADLDAAHEVLGYRLAQIYGLGESPMTLTALPKHVHADRGHPRWRERLGSVGTAQLGIEVVLRAADGTPVAAGEPGEITCRGDTVASGYWRDADASRAALEGGWLRTGDIGSMDDDGFVTLLARAEDVIRAGGGQVYPRMVEEVLEGHPEVEEVAVVGVPDEARGGQEERIVACVVAGAATSARALDEHCRTRLGRSLRPSEYVFLPRLPRNPQGKVLKRALRRALTAPPGR